MKPVEKENEALFHLAKALDEARKHKPSREMSLVITKIEEAIMWLQHSVKPKLESA